MSPTNTILLSSEYFPSIAWYLKYLQEGDVIIEQYERFEKASLRNRSYISGPNGILALSIPIEGGRGMHLPIKEIRVFNESKWQQQHWKSLLASYNRSPYFEYFEMDFAHFFEKQFQFLLDVNIESVLLLNKLMQIKKTFQLSDTFQKEAGANFLDFRKSHKLQHNLPAHGLHYLQPFDTKHGFIEGLSMVDRLFCVGKQSIEVSAS